MFVFPIQRTDKILGLLAPEFWVKKYKIILKISFFEYFFKILIRFYSRKIIIHRISVFCIILILENDRKLKCRSYIVLFVVCVQ